MKPCLGFSSVLTEGWLGLLLVSHPALNNYCVNAIWRSWNVSFEEQDTFSIILPPPPSPNSHDLGRSARVHDIIAVKKGIIRSWPRVIPNLVLMVSSL